MPDSGYRRYRASYRERSQYMCQLIGAVDVITICLYVRYVVTCPITVLHSRCTTTPVLMTALIVHWQGNGSLGAQV